RARGLPVGRGDVPVADPEVELMELRGRARDRRRRGGGGGPSRGGERETSAHCDVGDVGDAGEAAKKRAGHGGTSTRPGRGPAGPHARGPRQRRARNAARIPTSAAAGGPLAPRVSRLLA